MANRKIEKIKLEIIESFAKFPEMFGMNRAIGIIWGTLALEPDGLTMSELSKRTGYSLSTLSPYLRMLKLVNKVEAKKMRGVTKYYAKIETEKMIEQYMEKILTQLLEPSIKNLKKAEEELKSMKRTNEIKKILGRVRELKKHQLRMQEYIELALANKKLIK